MSPSQVPARFGLTFTFEFSINVLDSVIEVEVVTAFATFFSCIAPCCESGFSLHDWSGTPMIGFPNMHEYSERWCDVREGIYHAPGQGSELSDSDVQVISSLHGLA